VLRPGHRSLLQEINGFLIGRRSSCVVDSNSQFAITPTIITVRLLAPPEMPVIKVRLQAGRH